MQKLLEQDKFVELINEKILNRLLKLISAHPNQEIRQQLLDSFVDSGLNSSVILIKEKLEQS